MSLPYLDAAAVDRLLPLADAIEVIERGFASPPGLADPLRTAVEVPAGQLLLMPSHAADAVGVKLVSVAPGNPGQGLARIQGIYVLMDADTLAPRAVLDGSALTSLRTPAVSAVATKRLAVPDASRLVVFGAGPQAEGHVRAMQAVRPIARVRIFARDPASARRLAERLDDLELDVAPGHDSDLGQADVICTCTTARTPVVRAADVAGHVHVNAIGSHEPEVREVDSALVRVAQIAVETRPAALAEAGDLLIPLRAGEIDVAALLWDLGELVRGEGPVADPDRHSLFKSVGIAYADLLVATEVAGRGGF